MKRTLLTIVLCLGIFGVGWLVGEREGHDAGARHVLNPSFETDSFVAIVDEETKSAAEGITQYWKSTAIEAKEESLCWKVAAKHYGGICKWLLGNKPIYGSIKIGDNAIVEDCLIVSGSSDAALEINGENCLITDNVFSMIDMDWIKSLPCVDPNSLQKIPVFVKTGYDSN